MEFERICWRICTSSTSPFHCVWKLYFSHWILAFFCSSSSFFQKLFYFQQQLHLTLVQLLWLFKHFWLWKQWDKVWTFTIVPQWYFSFSKSKGKKDWQMESLIFMTLKFHSLDYFAIFLSLSLQSLGFQNNPWTPKVPGFSKIPTVMKYLLFKENLEFWTRMYFESPGIEILCHEIPV